MTADDAREQAAQIVAPVLAGLTSDQASGLNRNIAGALLQAYAQGVDTLTLGGKSITVTSKIC